MSAPLSDPASDSTGTDPSSRRYVRRVFVICLVGWILTNMDQSFFGYAVPSLMQEFGVGLPVIGNILSAAFVLAAVAVVVVGVLADRYGRRLGFATCLASSAALVGLQGFAGSIESLAVLRCLAFALSSGLVPLINAYVVEAAPVRHRGLAVGLMQCGYPLGWFIASLLAVPILATYDWRAMCLPAFAVVPLAFVLGRMLPESRLFEAQRRRRGPPASGGAIAALRALWAPEQRARVVYGWLVFFLFGGAYAGTAFYFPTFYQQVRGYSPEDATFVVGLSYGVGLIGYISSALVGEYLATRRNTSILWLWLGAIGVLGVTWNDSGFWGNVLWFSLTAIFFYGVSGVLLTFISEIFPTNIRATAVAVVAGVGINFGFAVYPVVVAALVERVGWQQAFTWAIVPSLVLAGAAALRLPDLASGRSLDELERPEH